MDNHELNSAALNGGAAVYNLVGLGPVSTGIVFYVYEETGEPMRATGGIDFSITADLTKIVQIGTGDAGITFSTTGNLIDDPIVLLGPVSDGINFALTSSINTAVVMGATAGGITFTSSVALTRARTLSGGTGINFATQADLTKFVRTFLPDATGGIVFDGQADLTIYLNMGAVQGGIDFDLDALLCALIFLNGYSSIIFDVNGNLFNNPAGQDIDDHVMIRPYVDRTMVRRS